MLESDKPLAYRPSVGTAAYYMCWENFLVVQRMTSYADEELSRLCKWGLLHSSPAACIRFSLAVIDALGIVGNPKEKACSGYISTPIEPINVQSGSIAAVMGLRSSDLKEAQELTRKLYLKIQEMRK